MQYSVEVVGGGTRDDPRQPNVPLSWVDSWVDNGDAAEVTLTRDAFIRVRGLSGSAADFLNGGSAWADIKEIQPEGLNLTLIKQDLVQHTKKKFSEFDTVPSGSVLAHDNDTTQGLWRAQNETTVEPTEGSSDWSLIFSV